MAKEEAKMTLPDFCLCHEAGNPRCRSQLLAGPQQQIRVWEAKVKPTDCSIWNFWNLYVLAADKWCDIAIWSTSQFCLHCFSLKAESAKSIQERFSDCSCSNSATPAPRYVPRRGWTSRYQSLQAARWRAKPACINSSRNKMWEVAGWLEEVTYN